MELQTYQASFSMPKCIVIVFVYVNCEVKQNTIT